MSISDARKLKALEAENTKLKRWLVDTMLDNADITKTKQCLEPYVAKGCTIITDRGFDAYHLLWLAGRGKDPTCIQRSLAPKKTQCAIRIRC